MMLPREINYFATTFFASGCQKYTRVDLEKKRQQQSWGTHQSLLNPRREWQTQLSGLGRRSSRLLRRLTMQNPHGCRNSVVAIGLRNLRLALIKPLVGSADYLPRSNPRHYGYRLRDVKPRLLHSHDYNKPFLVLSVRIIRVFLGYTFTTHHAQSAS